MGRQGRGGTWLASGCAGWLTGTAVQLQRAEVAGPLWAGAVLLAGLACGLLARRLGVRPGGLGRVAVLVAMACAAVAWSVVDWRAAQRLDERLDPALEGVDLVLTGVVAAMPRLSPIGQGFEFEVERARRGEQPVTVPPRLSLGWFHGEGEGALADAPRRVVAGERWQLPVRLKQAHGVRNPHGFDLELWLFERGLQATGQVRDGARRLSGTWQHPFEQARQAVRDAIRLRVADPTAAGVLAALAVGDQAAIERDDWDIFRITGVAHLMSISGLHVTGFAWLAAGAVSLLWRRSPRLMARMPTPDAARWGGLLLAAAYALLAGWGVPAQRTVGMLAVVTLVRALGWRWPAAAVWAVAGTAVIAADPWALQQPGFWLSFIAVGLLMAADVPGAHTQTEAAVPGPSAAARRGRAFLRWLREVLRGQAVATVGLAPLSLLFFQQVSVVGALANLLAIPWVTCVVMPLSLAGMLCPPLWQLGAWAVQGLMAVLEVLATLPGAVHTAAAVPLWAGVAGLIGGALLVMPLPLRLRLLGPPLMLPLLWPPAHPPAPGQVEVVAVDVGQGTAVLVRTHAHLLVYDAGPRYSLESDAGGRVLLPLLRARGEPRIDRLVLSHRDTDHTGGTSSLLRGVAIDGTLSSLEPGHALQERLPQHQRCEAGQRWQWDGVDFEVLHPRAEDYARGLPSNGLSCVLRVSDAQGPLILLTGDIEAAQEAELVARSPPGALQARWLLLPHHGSRTSSTESFLQAVQPQLAIAQAAYRSRFGHPAPDVRARLARLGIALVRSDHCGAWRGLDRAQAGSCERLRERRYWHHPGIPAADERRPP